MNITGKKKPEKLLKDLQKNVGELKCYYSFLVITILKSHVRVSYPENLKLRVKILGVKS